MALLFLVTGVLLLSATGVSFLAGNDAVPLSITPRPAQTSPGSTLAAGQSVKVTALQTANYAIYAGAAHKDSGLLLYKIEVQPTQSDALYVDFFWADPLAANGALKNGYIEVALYYQVGVDTTGCGSNEYSITGTDELGDGQQKAICVARAASSEDSMGYALLTDAWAATKLRSTVANKHFIYVLASVFNNGNNVAPGQQDQLGSLKFYVEATARS